MFNLTEKEERLYLKNILSMINSKLEKEQRSIDGYSSEIADAKRYVWENVYEMDPMEIASNNQSISQTINNAESTLEVITRLEKLRNSPYFGRIDFVFPNEKEAEPIYIGIYSFAGNEKHDILIYDWRAPISSMFYDYERGKAHYEAPSGIIEGEISLKRQYKIKEGEFEYFLESSLIINDDVLQRELRKTSDSKMKIIVTTIQREQNTIIRDINTNVLVIQGVAGSGKTSIALHRVAYLLYKFKDQLKSSNVLIVSPNKVFSDYIASVLPELGEQKILEVDMNEIAENELGKEYKFETFYEQTQYLLERDDEQYENRVKFKSTNSFLAEIKSFIDIVEKSYFNPQSFKVGDFEVSSEYVLGRYRAYNKKPIISRISDISKDIVEVIESKYNCRIKRSVQKEIQNRLLSMFKTINVFEIYRDFYEYLGKEEMLYLKHNNFLEYADVFPIIYLKMHLLGYRDFSYIKHLVVDEMQDYTSIQYAVLAKLFKCKKTILGDSNQSVNPFSVNNAETIASMFENSQSVKLSKSYRSTYEIINFAQNIINNKDLIAIERHGSNPRITKCENAEDRVGDIIKEFKESGYGSLGIICKTQTQAEELYGKISKRNPDITLLDSGSKKFKSGIIVTTAYISKGLEFDQVVVIDCDVANYKNTIDRGMLYIACTRAMHKLELLYTNELTKLIGL